MSDRPGPTLIFGAGGHARVVAALAAHAGIEIVGVLDESTPREGERILGHQVIGTPHDASLWRQKGAVNALLAIGDNTRRAAAFSLARSAGLRVLGLRHPSVIIEPGAVVADDAVLCAGVIVGAEARVGSNVLLNTGASVDHESAIGAHAHIAPRATVLGRVWVGDGAFLGGGSVVRDGVRIGEGTLVGAGAVVTADLPPMIVAVGIPAQVKPGLKTPWRGQSS